MNQVEFRRFDDIESKPIDWLWYKRIARGKLTILAGNPGLGKSQLTALMAAHVTKGQNWPVENTSCPRGSVIFLSAEDDAADTIRPRLEAVNADLEKTYILDAVYDEEENGKSIRRSFNLREDILRLDEMLTRIKDVVLIVIDPISAYLGETQSYSNAEVRALLMPLSDLAIKHNCAILGLTHLNKGGGKEALHRVLDSVAFTAAARGAYLVAKVSDEPESRYFMPIKNNIGIDNTGFKFSIESVTLASGIETSKISFHDDLIDVTADEALNPDLDDHKSAMEEAKEFLEEVCAIGRTASQVRKQAEEAGHSWATIKRAKQALGIKPKKDGIGPWIWRLPEEGAQGAQCKDMSTLSTFEKEEKIEI